MAARDINDSTVLLVPGDYLTWNRRLANALEVIEEGYAKEANAKKQIWILGMASDLALENLDKNGWLVQTKVSEKIGVNEQGLLK